VKTRLQKKEFQYTRNDLKAEIITFTAATLDGAAAAISPFIDNMLQHPEHCARVVAEIESADKAGKLSKPCVSYEETLELPFFMACIKETLRRDSPAQTILPRIVSEPGYNLPNGMHVPPNAQMGASPFIIHRNAEIFGPNPEMFIPSRWIIGEGDGVTETSIRIMEKYGMWWGYGDRECVGKYYAAMEMQKLVVEIFRRFDVKVAVDDGKDRFVHKRWAVGMFWGQMLSLSEKVSS
jgi:cytochrome P450